MAKQSTILKNWPKYLLQWGILAALIVFITGLIPSKEPVDPEAYCPMGGLQALTTYFANGSLPCSMSSLQIMMGIALAAAVILFSKLFCGLLCPLGSVQDLLMKLRNRFRIKGVNIRKGSIADNILRIFKYVILFWVFYMTATASELFCKNFDPYYAMATGFKGEVTLWMAIVSVSLFFVMGLIVDRFWCRYLCPLGAISNTLKFWMTILVLFGIYMGLNALGAGISWWIMLLLFCIAGYLLEILHSKPALQVMHVFKEENKCTGCGLCTKACPYHIDVKSAGSGKINSVDCTLCGECTASCHTGALAIGACQKSKGGFWKYVPAIVSVVLIAFGIWAGSKFELPTISVTWGIEQTAEDGTVTQLIDPKTLQTTEITGLRSVKCYGSSMAFKAKLQKIRGVYGVQTFVGHHRAIITYDPKAISPEQIQEAIYVPSKFRVATPDPAATDSVKVITIRTENMYDKMDINYLGLQMRATGRKIYGLETEFACPIIVRVFVDPSENLDEKWFENIVEMKTLSMPVHGGGTKEIELDYDFVKMEEEVSRISTVDLIHKMFNPFKAEFKQRFEQASDKAQYIYEIADRNYEKPIILRNLPYLSNHLSKHDGILGVYLELNEELVPAIRIRYAAPMTEEELWKLMTMDTWTITFKKDDVREVAAKMGFETKGKSFAVKK